MDNLQLEKLMTILKAYTLTDLDVKTLETAEDRAARPLKLKVELILVSDDYDDYDHG